MENSPLYRKWHSSRLHTPTHLFLLVIIGLAFASSLVDIINRDFLNENLANTAAIISSKPSISPRASRPISGQYIIQFKNDVKDPKGLADQLTKEYNGQLLFAYSSAVKGFAAKIPDVAINGLKKNPNIKLVEQDKSHSAAYTLNWGLDRIDQVNLPMDGQFNYSKTGSGVHIYIMDTGVVGSNPEFTGRVGNGFTSINDSYGIEGSCMWHGTHVAGIAAGSGVGVAKSSIIHSVRVLGCDGWGTDSQILAGVDWVYKNRMLPAVVNMSFGGNDLANILNEAINNSINSGIIFVAAAGNNSSASCMFYPGANPNVINVGATDAGDSIASYSNQGTCVDIFAPGTAIVSVIGGSNSAYYKGSGTSMASPFVAGVAATYLQDHPTANQTEVSNAIVSKASANVLTGIYLGSPNLLLNSLFAGTGPVADTIPPAIPTNLNATAQDSTHIKLVWAASPDNTFTTGYNIYRNDTKIFSSPTADYIDSRVQAGTTYNYSLSAFDAAGNTSTISQPVSITTPTINQPLDILGYSVKVNSSSAVTITWTTNVYSIDSVTYSLKGRVIGTVQDPDNALSHIAEIKGLKANTGYSFQINAVSDNAKDSVTGSFKTSR